MLVTKFFLIILIYFMNTSPIFAQSSSPHPTPASFDEAAIEKINVLIPERLSTSPPSKCVTLGIICAAASFFKDRLGFPVSLPGIFAARAELQQQSDAPEAVKSTDRNILDISAKDLGVGLGPGVYSNALPKEIQKDTDKTADIEQKTEYAWFYEKSNPITGH